MMGSKRGFIAIYSKRNSRKTFVTSWRDHFDNYADEIWWHAVAAPLLRKADESTDREYQVHAWSAHIPLWTQGSGVSYTL